ncbi:type II methionyl aminopeptidase [Candidatus Woesearchaeota archaeon]|nr:type II methionyl aminopeptidase [Nanoarchaeota archaeon]MCB9370711.1 type II methionyl aminopeptidase [Candidatus Woesearchaeota archaeon]USN43788.1 MAG: type II methionyl aminopeptidase [Candidatus Woesearchaeota archaeon]
MEELDIELLKEMGALTRQIRKEASKLIVEGATDRQIIDYVEKKIFDLGYMPAFPCTVAVNDMAAHLTVFDREYTFKKGDLVKLDFGISKNGFCTDNATTIEIGTNTYETLRKANFEGLNAAFESIGEGVSMSKVGAAVDAVAQKYGFETIHNLSGHQIAKNNLHCGMNVPNYDNGDSRQAGDNMEFAIEPFFTVGQPKIKAAGPSHILHLARDKAVRDPIAKKVLDHIKARYPHLPFSKRWLLKEVMEKIKSTDPAGFDMRRVVYAVNLLKQQGILYEYEALATVDKAMVSQFEDAIILKDGEKIIITRL